MIDAILTVAALIRLRVVSSEPSQIVAPSDTGLVICLVNLILCEGHA